MGAGGREEHNERVGLSRRLGGGILSIKTENIASSFGEGMIKSSISDKMRSVQNIKVNFQ